MVMCNRITAGQDIRPSEICFSKVIKPFELTVLPSKGFRVKILELFGHLLLLNVFPGTNVNSKPV